MNDAGFGIYVHWPFCLHKCPYCDFNSHIQRNIDYNLWLNSYLEAIDIWKDYRAGEVLTSVYFGGGTPSTCPPAIIDAILNRIGKYWGLAGSEITIEANPTSVEAANFAGYAKSGVNRVSIGFQAFNDRDLKQLGRMHSVAESVKALETARRFFPRTNFDLIYARQFQTLEDWENELNQVLKLCPSHISLYQLTIEAGTRFGDLYDRGKLNGLPDEALAHDMYVWTRDLMRDQGFDHYEVSNFARPDDQSRHNLIYWNYDDYLGIGPGAHGRLWHDGRIATTQATLPKEWLITPKVFHVEQLDVTQTAEEYVLMGLRIEDGIQFSRLDEIGYALRKEPLAELLDQNLIIQDNAGIRATDQGRLVLNHVINALLT